MKPPPKNPSRSRLQRTWWACVAGFAAAVSLSAQVPKEYQLKAAFLYNFTKFVDWPAERFANEVSPIVIGVLGRNPFEGELEKIARDRKVNGRAIVVMSISSITEAGSVHLLFVPAGGDQLLGQATSALRASGVLTVGESAQFAVAGGIINFTLAEEKLRFEINIAAAEKSRLKISSQLQKLATVVHRQP